MQIWETIMGLQDNFHTVLGKEMTVLALSQVGDLQETAGSSAGLWEVKWLKLMRKGGDVKDLLGINQCRF
ncbi:hypothetical protein Y1Q_0010916 [Alligator mississippiensis]|uniref:Uncharacterized protein n=1 Tax=Alligator mississippiensis TaxID=8496 RepID=A0A151MUQ2_ALLMI|nr:hypothetical protein Y1Q_0010916 [Alligator mississippiensis]